MQNASRRRHLLFSEKEVTYYCFMSNSNSGAGSWIALATLVTLWVGSYLGLRIFVPTSHSTPGAGHPGWSRVYTMERNIVSEAAAKVANLVYFPLSVLDEQVTGARTLVRTEER